MLPLRRHRPSALPSAGALGSLLITVALLTASVASAQGWTEVKRENGVIVWQKQPAGRDMPIFRGQTVIDANVYELLAVLADFDNHCKWMHGCHTARLLKKIDDYNRVSYNRTDAPWPIDDRDVVLRSHVQVLPEKHTVLIRFQSIASPLKGEVDGVVRMKRLSGYYMLTALSKNKTRVRYEVDTDPGGFLPDWVVAMASEDLPVNTLTNLRKRARGLGGQYEAFIAQWDPAKNPKAPAVIPE